MDTSREKDRNDNRLANRTILLRPANSGVEVVFFSLVVKLQSLKQKGNGDVLSLLRQTGVVWKTDGVLASTIAMGLDDLGGTITFIENLGLQSRETPADFYLFATDFGEPFCLTHNDGELEVIRDEGGAKVRLNDLPEQSE